MFDSFRFFFNIEMFDVRMFAISATKILGFLLFGCDIFHIAENVQKIPYLSKVFCDIDKYRNQRAKKKLMNDIATKLVVIFLGWGPLWQ